MLNDSWAGRNPTKGCSANWRRRIVYLCNTLSQGIKKQGDFWGYFWEKNATYEAGIKINRDLPYKINNK
jgi:hypothetical protein